MTKQLDDTTRAAMADAYETAIGPSPFLQIRTGAAPANCAAADSGSLIVEIPLPADFLTNPGTGVKAILGTWQATAALAGTNVAGHYRIKNNAKTATREQGTCTLTGGGGDMELQNTSVALGQQVTVTSFTTTVGGA